MALIIRTDNGDFDLLGTEDIVQTFSIFNLENITSRSGEYSNVFRVPLTNNNIQLIEYANLIQSTNTLPYSKISGQLIIDGIVFKTGFITIESIDEYINIRFFSGNTTFYDNTKSKNLEDLNWDEYNHTWNYANAVLSSSNTDGYTYPIIQYSGQNLAGDIINIRKVLPATFNKTIIQKMLSEFNYTSIYNFDTTDFDSTILPYSKKNPSISSQVLLLNKCDVGNSNNYNVNNIPQYYSGFNTSTAFYLGYAPITSNEIYINNNIVTNSNEIRVPIYYNQIKTTGSSTNFNFLSNIYTSTYSGNYNYNFKCDIVSYDCINFLFSLAISGYTLNSYISLVCIKISNGIPNEINRIELSEGFGTASGSTFTITNVPSLPTQTFINDTLSGTTYLNIGEQLYFYLDIAFDGKLTTQTSSSGIPLQTYTTVNFYPEIKDVTSLKIDLQPELVFGGLITYSSMLPKMKCNDYLKDICIRFGLIFGVDEDNKIITFNRLDKLLDNIPNSVNWSNKLNESDFPISKFSYNSYAQHNLFKHKEDKSILKTENGTDFDIVIYNSNLELSKDIYISPFASSEFVNFATTPTTLTAYINLYDVNTTKFDNDVQPRICFSELVVGKFKFTDGTSTSGYLTARRLWFIDQSLPNQSMGFGLNLIPKNSVILMSTLQNLRLMKLKFNLNFIDIKNLDYFTPIYLEQFQAYFFISSINQFNYTNPNLTEVELIKLNQ